MSRTASLRLGLSAILVACAGGGVGARADVPTSIAAGIGITDPSPHQLVRTNKNVLYAVVPDCPNGYPFCGANRIHVYAGTTPGTASALVEQDVTHAPTGHAIGETATGLDQNDNIHVLWIDAAPPGTVQYGLFSTATNRWLLRQRLQVTNWTTFLQGDEGVALAVDAAGTPHAVWCSRGSSPNNPIRIYYSNRSGGVWQRPLFVDGQAVPTGTRLSLHPAIAFDLAGNLTVAWLQGSFDRDLGKTLGFSFPIYYTPDGVIYSRTRNAAGHWGNTVSISDPAMTSIDDGPSMIITADGTKHITFDSAIPGHEDEIRYWYDSGKGWRGDQQVPAYVTHDPSLGPDGAGGVVIWHHGVPAADPINGAYQFLGYGANVYYTQKAAGSTHWGPENLYETGQFDDASSTRWSQFFHYFPKSLDVTTWLTNTSPIVYLGQSQAPLP